MMSVSSVAHLEFQGFSEEGALRRDILPYAYVQKDFNTITALSPFFFPGHPIQICCLPSYWSEELMGRIMQQLHFRANGLERNTFDRIYNVVKFTMLRKLPFHRGSRFTFHASWFTFSLLFSANKMALAIHCVQQSHKRPRTEMKM